MLRPPVVQMHGIVGITETTYRYIEECEWVEVHEPKEDWVFGQASKLVARVLTVYTWNDFDIEDKKLVKEWAIQDMSEQEKYYDGISKFLLAN